MKNSDLDNLFEKADESVISPVAKRRAMNAAMAEFDKNNAVSHDANIVDDKKNISWLQGFLNLLRPSEYKNSLSRKNDMNKRNNTWLYGSVATASVVVFAGFIGLRTIDHALHPNNLSVPDAPVQVTINDEDKNLSNKSLAENLLRKQDEEIVIDSSDDSSLEEAEVLSGDISQEIAAVSSSEIRPRLQSFAGQMKKERRSLPKSELAMQPHITQGIVPRSKLTVPNDYEPQPPRSVEGNRERFEKKEINPVKQTSEEPVSTFSIDVDTSSYSFVRRKLNRGVLPEKNAVRPEEMLNYFDYAYPTTQSKSKPFATHVIVGDAPWNANNKLLHIGIKGHEISEQRKSNIVFLLDVSGSMASEDKLPLVKQSMSLLLDQLNQDDTVAIVVYAGSSGTVLEPTKVKEKQKIIQAFNRLRAGGSTAGAAGIELAYQLAEQNFNKDAVNRIILATDGDFNVGIHEPNRLKEFVERKREKGIYLSVLGFGEGNYNDHMMQSLAQNGNGVAAYIDTLSEAQKVLVHEATSSLFPIAQDVKIQVEFNPATVAEYRLIGYETRALKREDFNNDKVDAGDIGAGHTVTAIYEITPKGSKSTLIDESRYAEKSGEKNNKSNEYALLKLRYKLPGEKQSKLIEHIIENKNTINENGNSWQQREFQFSSAVAGFAQLLKGGKYTKQWSYDDIINNALKSRGDDPYGYRNEFVQLVRKAKIAKEL